MPHGRTPAQDSAVSQAMHEANDACAAATNVPPATEYEGVDTSNAEANFLSRSNIVSDGPGTAGGLG